MSRKISWLGYKAKSQLVSEARFFVLIAIAFIVGGIILIAKGEDLGLGKDVSTLSVILFVIAAISIVIVAVKINTYILYIRQLEELPEDEYEYLHRSESKSHYGIWYSKHHIVAPEGFLIEKIRNVQKFDILKKRTNGALEVFIIVYFNTSRKEVRVPVNGTDLPGREIGLVLQKMKEEDRKESQKAQKKK